MSFDNVLGHEHAKELMRATLARGRLGHAYLFCGPDGVGKTLFALELAKRLFCRSDGERPCGDCPDCRMVDHGGHPDLFLIEAEKNSRFIKIKQARELRRTLRLMPVQSNVRVAIMREAERMKQEAANALLKTLEEPAPFAHLILITSRPRALPSTVRSRCQEVRFGPLSADQVRQILSALPEFDEDEVRLAARLAHGAPGRAIQVIESGCLEIYEGVLDNLLALPEGDFFALSDAILDWAHSVSSRLEPQRRRVRELLRLFACAYRDVLLLQLKEPTENLLQPVRSQGPAHLAERLAVSCLLRIQALLWEARRQIDANAAINLVLENLFARIAELQGTKSATLTG